MKHVFRRYVIFGKYLGCKANLALQSLQDEEVDSSLSVFLRRTNVHIPATVRDLAMASIDNTIKVLKVSDVEEDLTCAICKENPKEKLLNCGHSFCKTCLKAGKAGNGAITCGLCRRTTNVPGNDVEKLNTDFTAQNMEDKIQMKSLSIRDTHEEECGECSEGGAPAVAFCKDCNNPICKSCMEDHSKKKRLLSHMIVDLSERETKVSYYACVYISYSTREMGGGGWIMIVRRGRVYGGRIEETECCLIQRIRRQDVKYYLQRNRILISNKACRGWSGTH